MTIRARVVASIGGLLFWIGAARISAAADQEAILQQITSLNKAAIAAYSAGDFDKAKSQLLQAVALAKKDSELQTHPVMARTLLHLGVLYVDGFEDNPGGIAYFVKALKIRPDIEVSQALATKTVKSAFDEAKGQAGTAASGEAAPASAPAAKKEAMAADDEGAEEKPATKMTAAEKKKAAAEEKKATAEEEKRVAVDNKEKEKLSKEKAQAQGNEAKERAAKEKLVAEKADKEKQLAEAKASILQLQKEKADKDKQLADAAVREKNEREAKEKLEKEKQLAEAKEKERKSNEEKERVNREKLADGPDLPSHFERPIYCAIPDEAQAGNDLFVHCVAQANFKDKEIAFFYRASGGSLYNSLALEPSKKGWRAAMIPGNRVTGKNLQYYVEVRDSHGAVAAAEGKPSSPNILTLKSAGGSAARVTVTTIKAH